MLASGVLFLLLAVLTMGRIAQFLSRAVVTGFLFGAAIDVVIGELPQLTGTDATGSNPIQKLWSWFGSLGEAHRTTVIVGVIALAVVFGLKAAAPRAPGALVLVVGGLHAAACPVQKVDFWIAVAAILGTVLVGVLSGVLIGIGLSLIWLVAVATHPAMPTPGREAGTEAFREAD
jgi:MFS superfamily sulfate permease-like transporter